MDQTAQTTKGSRYISLLKTISWRVVGTIDTIVIAFILTGKIDIAVALGGIEVISKLVLYYFHEKAWVQLLTRKGSSA